MLNRDFVWGVLQSGRSKRRRAVLMRESRTLRVEYRAFLIVPDQIAE
jgi:hypothetical protein